MLAALRGAHRIFATETRGARRTPVTTMVRLAREAGHRATGHRDPAAALAAALRDATPEDTVLVCGSLYLAGALGSQAGR
jgi:folylpolyglutamate synthase/dihydropteroate synthase